MAAAQTQPAPISLLLLLFSVLAQTSFFPSTADVGTASWYPPPYSPTGCYGNDPSQFPTSNLFAAAGDGIWDNGAACGRQYLVRCISALRTGVCFPSQTVQIRIVDYALSSSSASASYKQSTPGATLVLSQTAFGSIANSSATYVNVEYQLV
ncbi:hypothetical protein MLD38_014385 [Melastoma candidum]|uniref:Uncharacterized protein n=1 Tax=Melastoma candidum TaxID=119954 RepID=A0ACB9RC93_9MYRT|nr:hypothetical protein MLD38_014385 [Melastoma candidum]